MRLAPLIRRVWAVLPGLALLFRAAHAADVVGPIVKPPTPGAPVPLQAPPNLPPAVRNPVDTLRQLLAKSQAEREVALANRSAKQRQYLEQRFREFDALGPVERELRLRLLQLRYFLLPLMKLPLADRAERLRVVPAEDRALIDERLAQWDLLPAQQQQELLQNEDSLHYFPRFQAGTIAHQQEVMKNLSPEQRQRLEADMAQWANYTADQRQRIFAQFEQFFEFSDRQREQTLHTFSDAERQQVERGLRKFEGLAPEQRAKCIEAYYRFSSMTAEERARFLDNAARWEAMSSAERHAWREFVAQLPPSPPELGFRLPTPPLPPAPPPPAGAVSPSVARTNR